MIFWLAIATQMYAQKTTREGFIVLPEELSTYAKLSELEKYYSGSKSLSSLTFSTKIPWYVYSDRNKNRTMESPNSSIPFGRELDLCNLCWSRDSRKLATCLRPTSSRKAELMINQWASVG